jgi:tripartite motif-containing protein 9/67
VKTFHDKRINYEFNVSIFDKLEKIRSLLFEKEPAEMSQYHVMKFVYAMGTIKTLNLFQTFAELDIPNNAQLVLLGQKTFAWDPNYKGTNLILLNNSLCVNKKQDHATFETVLGNVGFSSGSGNSKHYWEIKLDGFVELEDVFIGIARRNIDLNTRGQDTGSFWGYICGS